MFHVKQTFDKAVCRASSGSVQNISSVDRFFQSGGLFCNLSTVVFELVFQLVVYLDLVLIEASTIALL
jgi:hypothetical protein